MAHRPPGNWKESRPPLDLQKWIARRTASLALAVRFPVTPRLGQRFVLVDTVGGGEQGPAAILITQNWYEQFRDREQD